MSHLIVDTQAGKYFMNNLLLILIISPFIVRDEFVCRRLYGKQPNSFVYFHVMFLAIFEKLSRIACLKTS